MSLNESKMETLIYEIEKEKKRQKIVKEAKKKVSKSIKELDKELDKLTEGSGSLKTFEEDVLSDGVEKAAKKGKMWYRSVKALGNFSNFTFNRIDEFNLPENDELSYEEFKTFVRNLSNTINPIIQERQKADHVMGIDFMIKKRIITNPLNKIISIRDELRDLLTSDFGLIRNIENLKKVKDEIIAVTENKISLNAKIEEINAKIQQLENNKTELDKEKDELENTGIYSQLKAIKTDLFNLETDFGRRINPLKKDMRSLSSKASELGNLPFVVVTAAQNYEEDVIKQAHSDYENNFYKLNELLNALIQYAEPLKIKKNHVHKFDGLLKIIESEKLKKEFLKILEKESEIREIETSDKRIAETVAKINQLNEKIVNIESIIDDNNKEIEKTTGELEEVIQSLDERERRFNSLIEEGKEFS